MSRFWGGDDTDSEDEEELSPDESTMHLTSRFARTEDSDDEDEVKRVVQSHKDKHLETLSEISDSIDNNIDGKDYAALSDDFTKLNEAVIKWKKAAKSSALAPPPYYEGLLSLHEFLEGMDKNTKKSLDKKSARAVTALAQKFKKNLTKYNDEFEAYKEKVESGALTGSQEPDEQDEEDDIFDAPSDKGKEPEKKVEEPEEEDETPELDIESVTGVETGEKKKRTRKRNKNKAAKGGADGEWTVERVNEELKNIVSGKAGKKKLDKSTQVVQLRELLEKAKNISQELAIRMNIIATHFDQTISMKQHLSRENWMIAHNEIVEVLSLLEKNQSVRVKEAATPKDQNASDEFETARLVAFLGRLREELLKAFRALDSPAQEYIERVGDEELVLETARHMQRYYRKVGQRLEAAQISLIRMSFLHYRRDSAESPSVMPVRNSKVPVAKFAHSSKPKGTRSETLDKLLATVCQDGNERMKSHALLYTIYHHALEKRFFEARDLLLMSHLQDQIQHADVPTQILFNRATARMGLCAFRVGRIADAHNCLSELFQTNRLKELIAQGVTQQRNQNAEQDKIEKQRQVPYHTFMNIEQLECVHLISAMLLETPNMVAPGYDAKKRVISRSFRRTMDLYDRQVFTGPPESPKDHIIAAARSLRDAKADEAYKFAVSLRCWDVYPDPENVKEILERNIREVALQTFLLKHSGSFASVSVEFLAKTVGLDEKAVHTVTSRMMINEEIQSCWHQPSGTVVMHQCEANKLQSLVLQYADKVETFVAENERTFENRTGGFGYDKRGNREDDGDRKGGQGWRDGGRREGGGGRKNYRDNNKGGGRGNYGGRSEYRNWDNRRN
eukprot:CAMPEP_0201516818 /NCGR_PEP_ID=MMETSP0161_2-20130828/8066_1 /ASSEMBLY_ACC=CAM_ASM_000251 /TAXON_ID=180227 /ORGANISM="Neoparamoeba aestuarina, Strain SoJaBio B1-5/56/2" /LENGTH=846 /DNA_ID=CAMNT_0047914101 /DNA_START=43 /DNA_END=2583 /DNA_ORIENTATION=+